MKFTPSGILFSAAACYSLFAGFSILHQTGITGLTRKTNGTGCICHGISPTDSVVVRITGPDTVRAGSHYQYVLSIRGGPHAAGGFDIAAGSGSLAVADDSMKLENGELTHTSPKVFQGDSVQWMFSYTPSPAATADTLFSVGNSVNLDAEPSGDQWNFGANRPIRIEPDTTLGVGEENPIRSFRLYQNFPNPFNPLTRITFIIDDDDGASLVRLRVFNLLGREVAVLLDEKVSAGYHEVTWDGGLNAGGIYFARLEVTSSSEGRGTGAQRRIEVRKMVLLR